MIKNGFGEQSIAESNKDMSIDDFYAQIIEKTKKWNSFADESPVNPGETPEQIRAMCDLSIP